MPDRPSREDGLVLDGVSVVRAGRAVVQAVSVAVGYGSVLAILGPNGAGKTTLLEAIAGFHPFGGAITLDGVDLATLERRQRAQRMAYVPQRSRLEVPMRVRDVVAQGRFAHRGSFGRLHAADDRAIDEALAATDCARLAERPLTALSMGERRRVLVARALATQARLLLLDEPSASLDIGQALGLFALLGRLVAAGHAIVVVLHQLDEALRVADRALLLDGGGVVACGAAGEVIAREPVRRVYHVELIARGGLGYRAGRPESGGR